MIIELMNAFVAQTIRNAFNLATQSITNPSEQIVSIVDDFENGETFYWSFDIVVQKVLIVYSKSFRESMYVNITNIFHIYKRKLCEGDLSEPVASDVSKERRHRLTNKLHPPSVFQCTRTSQMF